MMRRSLLALLVAATTPLAAQDVTAFLDYRDRLVVFDKGTFSVVEGCARPPSRWAATSWPTSTPSAT
ncbi:MAG: hypothetical protein IPG35_14725 [Flavobacteriales bacterium]|nr:hypothetical protein [Flavobacteriales bacterium]